MKDSKLISFLLNILLSLCLISCASPRPSDYEVARINYERRFYNFAFEGLWQPAKAGDPRALYAMGYMYWYGIGTDKNQDLARDLIKKSACKNYPPAVIAMKLITERRFNQYLPFEKYIPSKAHGLRRA